MMAEKKDSKDQNKESWNRNARLIIRNISFKATEEALLEHFSPYGTVKEVKLLKKPDGKLVGCGFVNYANVQMAKKALASNKKPFLGRPILVDWAVPKHKYMQHVVNKQLEMQEDVKKEDSDDEDNNVSALNLSNEDLKEMVKSESDEDSSESDKNSVKSDEDSNFDLEGSENESENESDEDEEEDENEESNSVMEDNRSLTSSQNRIKLNDAEDGCTVFITNLPFSVDNQQLQDFAERTGQVKYALVCMDKLTEHSKGSGFIKFLSNEDADKFLALPSDQLRLEGQVLQVKPALKRENLQKDKNKQPKDNRNLYLVKEGVVVAGTKAAVGVSSTDMAKRLTLERNKTQMLKNLNRFVSRYRLVVANLPPNWDDLRLRRCCARAAGKGASITECRIMRDLRAPLSKDGKHPSKGYGFVMFTKHEDALKCLRELNNNPTVIDQNNRPIVSFSIEDRVALNARKRRLEKSKMNLKPHVKDDETAKTSKRKSEFKRGNDSKRPRLDDNNHQHNVTTDNIKEYSGLTSKEGSQHKMRNTHKLRMQADVHRKNVKIEKKKDHRAIRRKMAAKERVKQPKQKINKNKKNNENKKTNKRKYRNRNIFS